MSQSHSVIEINGNRYDAATGQIIGHVKKSASHLRTQTSGVVDGFVRQSSSSIKRAKYTAENVHKKTQRSSTLMRSVVNKPKVTATHRPHATAHHASKSTSHPNIPKRPVVQAKVVPKNEKVNRFGHSAPKAAHTVKYARPTPRQEQPHYASHQTAKAHSAPMPSMVASATHQDLERMLDHALLNANSHKRSHKKRGILKIFRFPKRLSVVIGLIIIPAAAALIAVQQVPQVGVRLASARANVKASVPSYTPSNFNLVSPISHNVGEVTLHYQASASNTKNFELSQKSSPLNSSSLEAGLPQSQIQTSQINGTTVYIYGKQGNASWISHGIRYTLKNNASLSSEQILKIANSL